MEVEILEFRVCCLDDCDLDEIHANYLFYKLIMQWNNVTENWDFDEKTLNKW